MLPVGCGAGLRGGRWSFSWKKNSLRSDTFFRRKIHLPPRADVQHGFTGLKTFCSLVLKTYRFCPSVGGGGIFSDREKMSERSELFSPKKRYPHPRTCPLNLRLQKDHARQTSGWKNRSSELRPNETGPQNQSPGQPRQPCEAFPVATATWQSAACLPG